MGRPKTVTYKADNSKNLAPHSDGSLSFGMWVNSASIRTPLTIAAREVVALAKAEVGRSADDRNGHYVDHFEVVQIFGGSIPVKADRHSKRAIVEVTNDAVNAVMLEFGSGRGLAGATGSRPQGGYNLRERPIGRAASKVGQFRA